MLRWRLHPKEMPCFGPHVPSKVLKKLHATLLLHYISSYMWTYCVKDWELEWLNPETDEVIPPLGQEERQAVLFSLTYSIIHPFRISGDNSSRGAITNLPPSWGLSGLLPDEQSPSSSGERSYFVSAATGNQSQTGRDVAPCYRLQFHLVSWVICDRGSLPLGLPCVVTPIWALCRDFPSLESFFFFFFFSFQV